MSKNETMSATSIPWKVRVILLLNLLIPTALIPLVFPSLGIVSATDIVDARMIVLLAMLTLLTSGAIIFWWEFLLRKMARALSANDEDVATEHFLKYKWLFLVTYFLYVFVSAVSPAIIVPTAEYLLGLPSNMMYYVQSSFIGAVQALLYYSMFFLIVDGILDEWGGQKIFNYQFQRLQHHTRMDDLNDDVQSSSRFSVIAFSLRYKFLIPTVIAVAAHAIIMIVLFREGIASAPDAMARQGLVFLLFTSLLLGTIYMQYRRTVLPVNEVLNKTKTLATGDLAAISMESLVIANLDEIGENMLYTRLLVTNLVQSAQDLINNAKTVGQKAHDYQNSFESLLDVSADIARAMNDVATGAERISDLMQEINKIVFEFKGELTEFDQKIVTLQANMKDHLKELRVLALNSFIELARARSTSKAVTDSNIIAAVIAVFSTLATEVQDLAISTTTMNEQIRRIIVDLKETIYKRFDTIASNVEEATTSVISLSAQFEEALAALEEETAIINDLQQPTEELVEIARKLESLARMLSKNVSMS